MVRVGALAALIATTGITTASAQVRATVSVNAVPVSGTVVIGRAPRPVVYPVVVYPVARPVYVRRAIAPNVLIVERVSHRGKGWWKRHGYQRTIVYTDGRYYYNGWMPRPGVTQVTVYARHGQYAMETGGRYDRMERDD